MYLLEILFLSSSLANSSITRMEKKESVLENDTLLEK